MCAWELSGGVPEHGVASQPAPRLALGGALMTTIGLARLGRFETAPYQACSRCGALTRVIREHAAPLS